MWRKLKITGTVVAAVLGIVLMLQNTHSANVKFLGFERNIPLVVLVVVTLLLGFILGIGVSAILRRRKKK